MTTLWRRLATLCLGGWLVTGCGTDATVDPQVITLAVPTAPNSLDPRVASDEMTQRVADLIYSPLMRIDDRLQVVPALAQRLDNPDPLTYIAVLRRGVRFHDGHELTSRDVVYTFESILAPDAISPWKGAYRMVASVSAQDEYTVVFRLREPFGAFPVQLVLPIVPDGAGESLRTFPVGTGPYRFVAYAVDEMLELAAYEGYFDGLPLNSGIRLKIVPDDTMRGLELRKGSVDLVFNDITPDIVHQLAQDEALTVTEGEGLDYAYVGFNMRDPLLARPAVRHAIAHAIDREAIVEHLRRGLARPATGLVPPQAWAYEPDVRTYPFDPARARALLDEAGFPDPDGPGPEARFALSLKVSTNEFSRLQATVIQEDLKRVGIDLDVRTYEFATLFADVLRGNFQLFSLQWVGGALVDPDILRRVFHSEQVPPAGFNRGYYSNPEVDRLLDLATSATTIEERQAYYGRAQQIIAEDLPYVSLWNRTNVAVASRRLSNVRLGPLAGFLALKDVRKGPRAPSSAP